MGVTLGNVSLFLALAFSVWALVAALAAARSGREDWLASAERAVYALFALLTLSVIGLEDVAVVVDGNEVLVTTMAGAQKVGKLSGAANQ